MGTGMGMSRVAEMETQMPRRQGSDARAFLVGGREGGGGSILAEWSAGVSFCEHPISQRQGLSNVLGDTVYVLTE